MQPSATRDEPSTRELHIAAQLASTYERGYRSVAAMAAIAHVIIGVAVLLASYWLLQLLFGGASSFYPGLAISAVAAWLAGRFVFARAEGPKTEFLALVLYVTGIILALSWLGHVASSARVEPYSLVWAGVIAAVGRFILAHADGSRAQLDTAVAGSPYFTESQKAAFLADASGLRA